MHATNELLDVLVSFLKNPPPLTKQDEFIKWFLPLYKLVSNATSAYYDEDTVFFQGIDYSKFSMDDLVSIRFLLNAVPSMEGEYLIEDAGEEQIWLDALLKEKWGDIDYSRIVRQLSTVRQEEVYF
jgi:hypothetical protein